MSDQIKQTKKPTQIKYEVCDHPIKMNEKWSQRANVDTYGKCICYVTCLRPGADITKTPEQRHNNNNDAVLRDGWNKSKLLITAGPASRQKAAHHESRLLRQSTCLQHTRFDKFSWLAPPINIIFFILPKYVVLSWAWVYIWMLIR